MLSVKKLVPISIRRLADATRPSRKQRVVGTNPMKTARMTILLTPEQKAAIQARAESLGLSTGELLRRAVETYGTNPTDDAAESEAVLNALADELFAAAKAARAALAAANRDVQATVKQLSQSRESSHVGG